MIFCGIGIVIENIALKHIIKTLFCFTFLIIIAKEIKMIAMEIKTTYIITPLCIMMLLFLMIPNTTKATTTLGSLTTTVEGGIAGSQHTIKPYISFKGEIPIFTNHTITALDEGITLMIASDKDDINFSKFIKKLTDHKDDILKIGHKIGVIKSDLGSLESSWFKDINNFQGKTITHITLTYEIIDFTPSKTIKNWTEFSYKITLTVFGKESEINYARVDYKALKDKSFATKGNTTKGMEKDVVKTATDGQHLIILKKNPISIQKAPFSSKEFHGFLKGIVQTWKLLF